jgi:hypothetical protein
LEKKTFFTCLPIVIRGETSGVLGRLMTFANFQKEQIEFWLVGHA